MSVLSVFFFRFVKKLFSAKKVYCRGVRPRFCFLRRFEDIRELCQSVMTHGSRVFLRINCKLLFFLQTRPERNVCTSLRGFGAAETKALATQVETTDRMFPLQVLLPEQRQLVKQISSFY